jgi:hypothetical protein
VSEPFDPASVETTAELPSWGDLAPKPAEPDRELPLAFARAFRGTGGAAVLANLKAMARAETALPPTVSDAELRYVEGQRSVVRHILMMMEKAKA